MAWIKMRHDLAEDPAVIGMALKLGADVDMIVGKLHRLWSWADRQTEDGRVRNVSGQWVDNYVAMQGFAAAMCAENWLKMSVNGGISFPNFARHNGASAKARAGETLRKQTTRGVRKMSGQKPDKSGTDVRTKTGLDKRREEKSREEPSSLRSEGGGTGDAPAEPSLPTPPEEPPPSGPRPKALRQCPADFALSRERFEYAVANGLAVADVGEEFEAFQDHRYRTPRTKWDLAWKAWVRKAVQIRGVGRSRTGPPDQPAWKNSRAPVEPVTRGAEANVLTPDSAVRAYQERLRREREREAAGG